MRKVKLILVFCGLLFSFTLSAQVFNAGISGGLNIAQIDGDGFSGYNKPGGALGLFVNTFFRESWAWQMEINYASKGAQRKVTLENPQYYKFDLRYIEIPLFVRYFINREVIIEGGLSAGYLFHSKEDGLPGVEIPYTESFRKTEFAAHGGIGYLLTDNISFHARMSYSILPVRDHAGGGTYRWNRGMNNNVISFLMQYQF
jgi:hypothetical protein